MKTIQQKAEALLNRPLKKSDGMSESEIKAVEEKLNISLPEILKEFYQCVGNLEMFMDAYEYFIEPYIFDNKLVFLEENQGVCIWGIALNELTDNNAQVYMCTDTEKKNTEWYEENVTLLQFIQISIYYQLAQGGYENGGAIYESNFGSRKEFLYNIPKITEGWEKVVDHNGLAIYQQQDKLIWYFYDREGNIEDMIYASTNTEKGFKEMEKLGFTEL